MFTYRYYRIVASLVEIFSGWSTLNSGKSRHQPTKWRRLWTKTLGPKVCLGSCWSEMNGKAPWMYKFCSTLCRARRSCGELPQCGLPSQAWPGTIISSWTCGRCFVLLLRYVFMCFCLHWTVSRPAALPALRCCAVVRAARKTVRNASPSIAAVETRLRGAQEWAVTVRVQARAAHQANNTFNFNFINAKIPW